MTRFDDIQARAKAGTGDFLTFRADALWLLDRVTRLETALTEILDTPLLETEARKIARAALDTEQP